MSNRALPVAPSLASLRNQARQLLNAWARADEPARVRVASALGGPVEALTLRDAQRVLALEYGMKSWAELRAAVAAALLARGQESASQAGLTPAAEFLDLACLTYRNHTESPARIRRAEQLLARQPEITVDNLFVLAALGDAERVSALLEKQPALASVSGGPRDWVPLLYLCFARVTQLDPVSTLKALLSHGADPNAHYLWGEPENPGKSSALTGVFGLGENGPVAEPPHPNRSELSRMLLAAGADPNDAQTLYNCHFQPDNVFLEILFEYGLSAQSLEQGIGLGGVGYPWLLVHAAQRGFTARVKLLLAHGVNPNATDREGRTAYAIALSAGHEAIAEELARAGAERRCSPPARTRMP